MKEERRLVWRVLRNWTEIAHGGCFPRCEEIDPWMRGEDGANCVLIAVEWSIELSHFVVVGVNLAVALCPTDTLAGVLLSCAPQVVYPRTARRRHSKRPFWLARFLSIPASTRVDTVVTVWEAASCRLCDRSHPPEKPLFCGGTDAEQLVQALEQSCRIDPLRPPPARQDAAVPARTMWQIT